MNLQFNRQYQELPRGMQDDLHKFVNVMVEKLHKNLHKNTINESDVPKMVELLTRELGEFIRQYMEDKKDPNAPRELADIANFAFLIYQTVHRNDIPF